MSFKFQKQSDKLKRNKLLAKQNQLAAVYKRGFEAKTLIFYQKLKFQQTIYSKGDFLEILALPPQGPLIARLSGIIYAPDQEQKPFIEVEWCLKKCNLGVGADIKRFMNFISQAQIFPSKMKCYLAMESIISKCEILTVQEYFDISSDTEHIYFSRAIYDEDRNLLVPPPKEWQCNCRCNMPINPDLEFVECWKCMNDFHIDCIGKIRGDYVCVECIKK